MQVSAEYPPATGGVGDYTHQLGRALLARGHRVAVLTGQPATSTVDRGSPERVVLPRNDWSWRSLPPLLHVIGTRRPDIVHIQYQAGAYAMHPAINLLPRALRQRRQRPRVVVTMHDLRVPYLLPKAGPLRHWVTRRLLVDSDAVVVTNSADRRRLAGGGRPGPDLFRTSRPIGATVVPIGSNVLPRPPAGYERHTWRAVLGVRDGDTVVSFFGLASPSKGLLPLVQALAGLPVAIRLLVVGGEAPQPMDQQYMGRVHAAIEAHGLGSRVHITGYCPPELVSAHLLAADIGALPFEDGASYRRGSLLALLAHGVPVITTRPEAPLDPPLEDGEQALLVGAGSVPELRAAILRLADEPDLRRRLSDHGRALHAHFSWPAIAAAHEALYSSLPVR